MYACATRILQLRLVFESGDYFVHVRRYGENLRAASVKQIRYMCALSLTNTHPQNVFVVYLVAAYLLCLEQKQHPARTQDPIVMQEATAPTSKATNFSQDEQQNVRKRPCGECEPCLREDCGVCKHCQ